MKKNVWFDVDDVCVDTATQIYKVMLEKTGKDIPVSSWTSMYFTDFYQLGKDRVEEMRGWWKEFGIIEKAEPFMGTLESMRKIAKAGHVVNLITARDWHPNARNLTEDFVNKYNLPVKEIKLLAFGESKTNMLKEQAHTISAFIDDSDSHVRGMKSLGVSSVLVRRPWNQKVLDLDSILDGEHFYDWMKTNKCLNKVAHKKVNHLKF
jgi:hypothetical protein